MLEKITEALSKSQKVNSFDTIEQKECPKHCILCWILRNPLKKNSEYLIPMLLSNNPSGDNIEDVLLDIGEELKHIIYHINSSKFYI